MVIVKIHQKVTMMDFRVRKANQFEIFGVLLPKKVDAQPILR